MGAHQAVLVYDGYVRIDIGRTDALFVEARDYATGEQLSVALPYRNVADPAGFAVYRPKRIADPEPFVVSEVGGAFFRGVADHERGAEVWNAHIDERH